MRYLVPAFLLVLTFVIASPAAAAGPSAPDLPGVDFGELVFSFAGWLGIVETVETAAPDMGPGLEPNGREDNPPKTSMEMGPIAESGGAEDNSAEMGPALEPGG